MSIGISHNVPAVYDVFAAAIKETVGFQQPQKCGGEKPHQGRRPTAVFRSPSRLLAAKHIQSCYAKFGMPSNYAQISLLRLAIKNLLRSAPPRMAGHDFCFIIYSSSSKTSCLILLSKSSLLLNSS
jgi:hypothetical protein